mgnify:CR=1 FL=1
MHPQAVPAIVPVWFFLEMVLQMPPGMEGLLAVAEMEDSEILVTAIVGMIGIQPTIAAIKKRKDIALANKETLVTAGHIIMPLAAKMGVSILPVDSEHSAIFHVDAPQPESGSNQHQKAISLP